MARTSKTLALVETTSTSLTTIYTAPSGINTNVAVVSFTNLSASANHVIDIYQNNGTSDFLKKTISLPAGIGNERLYHGGQRIVLNSGHILKIQSSSASAFNTAVYGSEVEV